MIDIILGDVLVVWARLRATPVVTLRCSKLSDIAYASQPWAIDPSIGCLGREASGKSPLGRSLGLLARACAH